MNCQATPIKYIIKNSQKEIFCEIEFFKKRMPEFSVRQISGKTFRR